MFEQISMFDLMNPVESRFTYECRRGSGWEGGKVRIYCASLNMCLKEFAVYLKEEYGIGGHSSHFPDGTNGFSDHNAKGIQICEWKHNEVEKHSWQEVAREIKRLILNGDYLDEKEKAKVQEVCQHNGGKAPFPVPRCAWAFERSAG